MGGVRERCLSMFRRTSLRVQFPPGFTLEDAHSLPQKPTPKDVKMPKSVADLTPNPLKNISFFHEIFIDALVVIFGISGVDFPP